MIEHQNKRGISIELRDLKKMDKIAKLIEKKQYENLSLIMFENVAFWEGKDIIWDLAFVKKINPTHIKKIDFTGNCSGYENLYHFKNLEKIIGSPRNNEILDLSQFPKLKELSVDNLKGFTNFSDTNITNLILFDKKVDFKKVCEFIDLESLNCDVDKDFSFEKIASLKKLRELCLSYGKFETLDGIEELENLEHISIFVARNLKNVDALSKLPKLKKVIFTACVNLDKEKVKLNCEVKFLKHAN